MKIKFPSGFDYALLHQDHKKVIDGKIERGITCFWAEDDKNFDTPIVISENLQYTQEPNSEPTLTAVARELHYGCNVLIASKINNQNIPVPLPIQFVLDLKAVDDSNNLLESGQNFVDNAFGQALAAGREIQFPFDFPPPNYLPGTSVGSSANITYWMVDHPGPIASVPSPPDSEFLKNRRQEVSFRTWLVSPGAEVVIKKPDAASWGYWSWFSKAEISSTDLSGNGLIELETPYMDTKETFRISSIRNIEFTFVSPTITKNDLGFVEASHYKDLLGNLFAAGKEGKGGARKQKGFNKWLPRNWSGF